MSSEEEQVYIVCLRIVILLLLFHIWHAKYFLFPKLTQILPILIVRRKHKRDMIINLGQFLSFLFYLTCCHHQIVSTRLNNYVFSHISLENIISITKNLEVLLYREKEKRKAITWIIGPTHTEQRLNVWPKCNFMNKDIQDQILSNSTAEHQKVETKQNTK